ncbi:MAG: ABC transporter permease [Proteiniphilum sp.]|jgi:lipoprotein-releasing system permease protein|nr:ABC transporter permease [Proteiniphilum sp.]
MNTELFIAKRIYKGDKRNGKRVSSPAIRIAIAGVALGLAVMIISVCIIVGFKKEIRTKVTGFESHIRITAFEHTSSYEHTPIVFSDTLAAMLAANPEIRHVQKFITKPGIIKTDDDFMGVVLKGTSEEFDWDFFGKNMQEGTVIQSGDTAAGNRAIISKEIADRLRLKTGDSFTCYFVQEPVRVRRFEITGIYSTGFESYDHLFVIVENEVLSTLNGWDADMVSGIEVSVRDYGNLDRIAEIAQDLFFEMASYRDRLGNTLYARSVRDINPMIFSWLNLLDMNVWVIIILMTVVSGFTMISGLLIIILERTNMIGMLKSMGARDFSIRKIFLYLSAFLIGQGMCWGNIIALAFCFIQDRYQPFKLDPSTYYLPAVPVDFNPLYIVLLNVGTLTVSLLMMTAPSCLVARITPAKSIRFE